MFSREDTRRGAKKEDVGNRLACSGVYRDRYAGPDFMETQGIVSLPSTLGSSVPSVSSVAI